MRVSCNGCRVLRKGCTENCSIRPCLQWITSPESQSNATLFLAKFYGRAGLQNLINAGPPHLRPAIFRSLLYEACGRIVNPIYGSAGLLCAGNWHLCHAAVEAVLNGAPITQVSPDSDEGTISPPLKACDIRHVSKDDESSASRELHKVKTSRSRFKRTGSKQNKKVPVLEVESAVDEAAQVMWSWSHQNPNPDRDRSGSHDSVMTHRAEPPSLDGGDVVSMEALLSPSRNSDVELELTLGSKPSLSLSLSPSLKTKEFSRVTLEEEEDEEENQLESDRCEVELGLRCSPAGVS
ncbi:LOB domain-containing protein 40-like [Impatiens glandulifera]|uniref:LOB domain-containing protein 40-like n=1 Tax=Impatiens glandulifera TaxID=253017 RepID=UPI001FB14948|nr:LOB domain-containing protein 40-like [Impatiens glandulifera]